MNSALFRFLDLLFAEICLVERWANGMGRYVARCDASGTRISQMNKLTSRHEMNAVSGHEVLEYRYICEAYWLLYLHSDFSWV
jgi:hypothetical protein